MSRFYFNCKLYTTFTYKKLKYKPAYCLIRSSMTGSIWSKFPAMSSFGCPWPVYNWPSFSCWRCSVFWIVASFPFDCGWGKPPNMEAAAKASAFGGGGMWWGSWCCMLKAGGILFIFYFKTGPWKQANVENI